MQKIKTKLSPEKLARIALLKNIAQNPIKDNLEELKKLLSYYPTGLLLEEAAKKIGTNEQGINTILVSTGNKDISTFSRQKGEIVLKYIILTVNLSNVA